MRRTFPFNEGPSSASFHYPRYVWEGGIQRHALSLSWPGTVLSCTSNSFSSYSFLHKVDYTFNWTASGSSFLSTRRPPGLSASIRTSDLSYSFTNCIILFPLVCIPDMLLVSPRKAVEILFFFRGSYVCFQCLLFSPEMLFKFVWRLKYSLRKFPSSSQNNSVAYFPTRTSYNLTLIHQTMTTVCCVLEELFSSPLYMFYYGHFFYIHHVKK